MKQVYLLIGQPGTGKPSLLKQVVAGMKGKAGGFYTEEIRSQWLRHGFSLVSLDGQHIILAHIDIDSPYRVSNYGIDLESLEHVVVSAPRRVVQQKLETRVDV